MKFTDAMRDCLKNALERGYYDGLTNEEMFGLLARLETAEAFTQDAYKTHTIHYGLYEAWQKATGK